MYQINTIHAEQKRTVFAFKSFFFLKKSFSVTRLQTSILHLTLPCHILLHSNRVQCTHTHWICICIWFCTPFFAPPSYQFVARVFCLRKCCPLGYLSSVAIFLPSPVPWSRKIEDRMKSISPYHSSLVDCTQDVLTKGISCWWYAFNKSTAL